MSSRPRASRRSSIPLVLPVLLAHFALGAGGVAVAQQTAGAAGNASGAYAKSTHGTRVLEAPGVAIKVLVEAANYGSGEVEVAELTLTQSSAAHKHSSAEIIYILDGVLEHVVNGESHRLEPGMVGIVKPGDSVVHKVASEKPVKALLIWAPGGEAERLAKVFKTRAVETAPAAAKP
jgi:quercetin dioxygenase-like cupin family protein